MFHLNGTPLADSFRNFKEARGTMRQRVKPRRLREECVGSEGKVARGKTSNAKPGNSLTLNDGEREKEKIGTN